MVAGAIGLLAAVLALLLLIDANRAAAPDRRSGTAFAGSIRPPGPPVQFRLTDERGRRVDPSALRGRPLIVTFMYTACEDGDRQCPTTAQQIRAALDDVGSKDRVPVIAVSVDPASDTPRKAVEFLEEQQMTGRMRFALGDRSQLERVWRTFGVQPQGHDQEHSSWVVLLDSRGRQRIGFPADKLTPEGLQHDLLALLREPHGEPAPSR